MLDQADPTPTVDLRGRHGAHRRRHLDLLSARARRDGDRLVQRHSEFRCGRRPLPERQRHLPRSDRRPRRIGRAVPTTESWRTCGSTAALRCPRTSPPPSRACPLSASSTSTWCRRRRRRARRCATDRPSTKRTPRIGQDIAGLLTEADKLVNSVGNSRLQDLLRETFKAFNGSGPELARLIQSSRLLVDEANANYGQITQLIDQAGPFLDAQIRSGDDIKSLADGPGPVHR